MKLKAALLLLVLSFSAMVLNAQNAQIKTKLRVLFVGYDPSKPLPEAKRMYPGGMSKEAFIAEYPVRMPAFKELLGNYFTEVKTMDCRDWKPADSDPFDVKWTCKGSGCIPEIFCKAIE